MRVKWELTLGANGAGEISRDVRDDVARNAIIVGEGV